MTNHALAALGQRHAVHDWVVADATARGALTLAATDIGKVAWQQDDNSLWFLVDDSPATWEQMNGGGGSYTDEDAMDAIAAAFAAGTHTGLTITYTDGSDKFDFAVTGGGLTQEQIEDFISTFLVAGTGITLTYDDGLNTLTIDSSGGYTDEQAQDTIAAIIAAGTHVGINITYSDATPSLSFEATGVGLASSFQWTLDEGGVPATNEKAYLIVPFNCTITEAYLLADQTGDIVIDVWKDTYANFPPTVADTITASAKPTLTGAQKAHDTTLTGWTTSLSAGDVIMINVDSASTVTLVNFTLIVERA